jgi:hypothetical protein
VLDVQLAPLPPQTPERQFPVAQVVLETQFAPFPPQIPDAQ